MAYTDYLTTRASVWIQSDTQGDGGAVDADPFVVTDIPDFACSQPVPTDPSKGETMGRDGLILTHKVYFEGPRNGIRPGHQLRIDGRRFDVDCELDSVGFGRIVKVLCREVIA